MKYLCLIYDDEKLFATTPKPEIDKMMGEYRAFGESIKKSGHHASLAQRQGLNHRRTVRRNEGAARRILPHRSQGSERRTPGRLEDPIRENGLDRGEADRRAPAGECATCGGTGRQQRGLRRTPSVTHVRDQVEALYRTESRRVLATLIRLLDDFDLAEEALHDAFAAAVEQWETEGVPANPRAWLVSTGRFKAIDRLRRDARFETGSSPMIDSLEASPDPLRYDDELE